MDDDVAVTRLAAERAQRQRRAARGIHRRQEYQDSLDEVIKEEALALRKKHGLEGREAREPFSDTLIER
jgi:hypothetical protein